MTTNRTNVISAFMGGALFSASALLVFHYWQEHQKKPKSRLRRGRVRKNKDVLNKNDTLVADVGEQPQHLTPKNNSTLQNTAEEVKNEAQHLMADLRSRAAATTAGAAVASPNNSPVSATILRAIKTEKKQAANSTV